VRHRGNISNLIDGKSFISKRPNRRFPSRANALYKNIEFARKNARFELIPGDLTDDVSLNEIVKKIKPDYFINFAANSFVKSSWDMPIQVMNVNTLGVIRCLEAIRSFAPSCRFYSAGSSEEIGDQPCSNIQTIETPPFPRSIYAVSKVSARYIVKVYRESYGLWAIHGRLYNHESPRRGSEFISKKCTENVARIFHNKNTEFEPMSCGALTPRRDWSHAKDFVDGIWLMLNQPSPKEYLLSSGETHPVWEFIEKGFRYAGFNVEWKKGPKGIDDLETILIDTDTKKTLVNISPEFFRPADVPFLLGDSSKIRKDLGWQPKYSFDDLIKEMVKWDIDHYPN